jgi:Ca2+-binding EF-hand superfamily protein
MKPGKAKKTGKQATFDPSAYERPGLTREEISEIKEAFDLFDTDGS